jgi:hypothetical protein
MRALNLRERIKFKSDGLDRARNMYEGGLEMDIEFRSKKSGEERPLGRPRHRRKFNAKLH